MILHPIELSSQQVHSIFSLTSLLHLFCALLTSKGISWLHQVVFFIQDILIFLVIDLILLHLHLAKTSQLEFLLLKGLFIVHRQVSIVVWLKNRIPFQYLMEHKAQFMLLYPIHLLDHYLFELKIRGYMYFSNLILFVFVHCSI